MFRQLRRSVKRDESCKLQSLNREHVHTVNMFCLLHMFEVEVRRIIDRTRA